MYQVKATSGDFAYVSLADALLKYGQVVSPRGQDTSELLDVTVRIDRPELAPPLEARRNVNLRIAATETVQLLAGYSSLTQLDAASNGRFSRYATNGRLLGAYGPRLSGQLERVEEQLRADPDTRQAVAVVWNRDEVVSEDTPCTVALTFRIRDGRLGLKVHMRSNDVHLGVPYDWFIFSRLQLAMAEVLGLRAGPYVHHADSMHLYHRNVPAVDANVAVYRDRVAAGEELVSENVANSDVISTGARPFTQKKTALTGDGDTWDAWDDVRDAARLIMFHELPVTNRDSTSALTWYLNHVSVLPLDSVACTGCGYVMPRDETMRRTTTTNHGTSSVTVTRPLCASCHGID